MIEGLRFLFTRDCLIEHIQVRILARTAAIEQCRADLEILREKEIRYRMFESLWTDNDIKMRETKEQIDDLGYLIGWFSLIKKHFHNDDYSLSISDMQDLEMTV